MNRNRDPLSPSDSSPNKLGERVDFRPPTALLGEVPEGRSGLVETSSFSSDFRAGFIDMAPMLLVYVPVAMLWGAVATAKGFSPFEAFLMSFFVYAGTAQFIAVDMWREPLPIAVLVFTTLIVNLRLVMMSASISRHIGGIAKHLHPFLMFILTDEAWAIVERRAAIKPLSLAYYVGVALPLWPTWFVSSTAGALLGSGIGNPATIGLDFAYSAMLLSIVIGFWRGPRTGVVIAASGLMAAAANFYLPGAWYILLGGLAGVAAAALLHSEDEA